MKIKGLLILALLLLVGCSVVTAADTDDNSTTSDLEESAIEASVNQISNENIIKEDNNEVNEKVITDNTQENKTISKESKNLRNNKGSTSTTFTLTDDTWNDYFANNGSIREDIVSEGNVLAFEGEFEDRFMLITIPVNITSGAEQAYLTNCLFYVTASNTNITGLNIDNTDYDEYVIYLEDVTNVIIENNNLSLTNNDAGITTHTLEISNSNNVLIINNTIYTVGPEENLDTKTGICVTTSINALNSTNITLYYNNITTTDNGNTRRYGTIYGVFLKGNTISERATGFTIRKNNIVTNGKYYLYGLTLLFAEDYLINDNNITTISGEYANGLQLEVVYNGLVNNNTIYTKANNFTYPIYCVGRVAREMIYSTGNTFSNNTLYAESITTYLFEFFLVKDSTINYNNMSAKVDYGTGIGTSQSGYNYFEYNTINITFNMQKHITNPDAIPDNPSGITVTTIQAQAGVNNTIRYNNITVYSPETESIPAINLISTNNTAYRNYLISSQGAANEAVSYTEGNLVYDNYPTSKIDTQIIFNTITDTRYKDNVTVTGKVADINAKGLGNVNALIRINSRLFKAKTDRNGNFTLTTTANRLGTNNVTIGYAGNDKYNSNTTSTTFQVIKQDINITYDPIQDTRYKDNLTINGKVTDINGNPLYNINTLITLNGKLYKAKTDTTGAFTLTITTKTIGINNITLSYAGSTYYNGYQTSTTFNVEKQNINITYNPIQDTQYRNNITINGKVTDINGNTLTNINTLITLNGKLYKAKTDSTGTFTLTITATNVGTNNLTLGYGGSTYYNGIETSTTFNVEKQDINITYNPISDVVSGDNVTITGRVADVTGKGLGNINAQIHINGKLYKTKTDNTGVFTFTTQTTTVGCNNVTIGYAGNACYNTYETSTTFNVLAKN